jgi:hypothetical protein
MHAATRAGKQLNGVGTQDQHPERKACMAHYQDRKGESCLEWRVLRLLYLLFLQGATGVGDAEPLIWTAPPLSPFSPRSNRSWGCEPMIWAAPPLSPFSPRGNRSWGSGAWINSVMRGPEAGPSSSRLFSSCKFIGGSPLMMKAAKGNAWPLCCTAVNMKAPEAPSVVQSARLVIRQIHHVLEFHVSPRRSTEEIAKHDLLLICCSSHQLLTRQSSSRHSLLLNLHHSNHHTQHAFLHRLQGPGERRPQAEHHHQA